MAGNPPHETFAENDSDKKASVPQSSSESVALHKRNADEGNNDADNSSKRPKVDVEESPNIEDTNAVVTPTSTSTETKPAPNEASASASIEKESTETLDLAETLGLKSGTEIEVQWEIHNDKKNDAKPEAAADAANDSSANNITLHWWKAKLLPHDGRTTDSVAIRTLHYEARPDLGFPEPSKEDVVFLGRDVLVTSTNSNAETWDTDPDSVNQMPYRRVESNANDEVFFYNEDQLEEQLNTLLMGAFSRNQAAWNALPAAQKALIAEQIAKKKKQLATVLREKAKQNNNQIITPEAIQEILQQTF